MCVREREFIWIQIFHEETIPEGMLRPAPLAWTSDVTLHLDQRQEEKEFIRNRESLLGYSILRLFFFEIHLSV